MMMTPRLKTCLLLTAALFLAPAAYARNAEELLAAQANPFPPSEVADPLDPSAPMTTQKAVEEGSGGEDVIAATPAPQPVPEESKKSSAEQAAAQAAGLPQEEVAAPLPEKEIKRGSRAKDGDDLIGNAPTAESSERGMSQAALESSSQPLLDALRTAYINNPTLRAARAEMKATAEALPQAQSGWMPQSDIAGTVTSAEIDSDSSSGDGTTSRNLELSLTQPLYRGGRTISGIGSARDLILAQGAVLNATEQQLLLSAATAYMDVVLNKALVNLSENNIEVVSKQLEASRNRFEVGEVTRTDVAQSEARLALAEATRISAVANLKSSLATYEQVVGGAADGLTQAKIEFRFPETLDDAIALAEKNSPGVVASEYLHQSAEKDIGKVFGELLPELGLSASWDKTWNPQPGDQDDSATTSLSLVATIPLYEGGYTRSQVRQAKYVANQRYIEIIESRRAARQDVISNWENLMAAKAEILSRRSQVEASRVAQEGVRQEAELGTRTILDALDADQEYLDAQVALVSAERDEVVASFALAQSLGILTPEVLGFPEVSYNPLRDMAAADWKMLGLGVDRVD
ncbi:MAG: TolC family outer membrane protein [Micavibrio aeruginosavorus]|uniref:TolC family outer membrane protein n=1 Tax=Micavibrio aeruginosavorus TaxID=349221 RepID=A0A7T5UHC6_9BACT|nr:MAG: TolC family outer membrane protein [Micavibrio aeruginosavorus]